MRMAISIFTGTSKPLFQCRIPTYTFTASTKKNSKLKYYPDGIKNLNEINSLKCIEERNRIMNLIHHEYSDVRTAFSILMDPGKAMPILLEVKSTLDPIFEPVTLCVEPKEILMQTRLAFLEVAKTFKLNPRIVEPFNGVILPTVYEDEVFLKDSVVVDISERGHGAIAHLIQKCMIAQMEKKGLIQSAKITFQQMAEGSKQMSSAGWVTALGIFFDNPAKDAFCGNPATTINIFISLGGSTGQVDNLLQEHREKIIEISKNQTPGNTSGFNIF
jgi:hypothetical protein